MQSLSLANEPPRVIKAYNNVIITFAKLKVIVSP